MQVSFAKENLPASRGQEYKIIYLPAITVSQYYFLGFGIRGKGTSCTQCRLPAVPQEVFTQVLQCPLSLRMVPTIIIVIAHTFCAPQDTWISYG